MNGQKTNNDQLGLVKKWYAVPKDIPRPDSAVKYDRKGGIAMDADIRQQATYWRSRQERYKNKADKTEGKDDK